MVATVALASMTATAQESFDSGPENRLVAVGSGGVSTTVIQVAQSVRPGSAGRVIDQTKAALRRANRGLGSPALSREARVTVQRGTREATRTAKAFARTAARQLALEASRAAKSASLDIARAAASSGRVRSPPVRRGGP